MQLLSLALQIVASIIRPTQVRLRRRIKDGTVNEAPNFNGLGGAEIWCECPEWIELPFRGESRNVRNRRSAAYGRRRGIWAKMPHSGHCLEPSALFGAIDLRLASSAAGKAT